MSINTSKGEESYLFWENILHFIEKCSPDFKTLAEVLQQGTDLVIFSSGWSIGGAEGLLSDVEREKKNLKIKYTKKCIINVIFLNSVWLNVISIIYATK